MFAGGPIRGLGSIFLMIYICYFFNLNFESVFDLFVFFICLFCGIIFLLT